MRRGIFTSEHEDFRLMIREFVEREIVGRYASWEEAGEAPREFYRKLGSIGVMGMAIPEKFGGYGYITEYPIARLYADARVTRVYGGTSEVMKSIISKSLGL